MIGTQEICDGVVCNTFTGHFRGVADVLLVLHPFVFVLSFIICWVPFKRFDGKPLLWVGVKQWPLPAAKQERDGSFQQMPLTQKHFWWWTSGEALAVLFVASVPSFLLRFLPLSLTGQLLGFLFVGVTWLMTFGSYFDFANPQVPSRVGYPARYYEDKGVHMRKVVFASAVMSINMCLCAINYPAVESVHCGNMRIAWGRGLSLVLVIPVALTSGSFLSTWALPADMLRDCFLHFGLFFVWSVFQGFGYVDDWTCEIAPKAIQDAALFAIVVYLVFLVASYLIFDWKITHYRSDDCLANRVAWWVWISFEWLMLACCLLSAGARYSLAPALQKSDILVCLPSVFTFFAAWKMRNYVSTSKSGECKN